MASTQVAAPREDAKIAVLFETFPSQDAPAADFARALDMVDVAAGREAERALHLLWPLWRRVAHLRIAERAVRLCAQDLSWAHGVDATAIARRCAASLTAFPEIELAVDRAALAQALVSHGAGAAALYFEMLAHIVAPDAPDIVERLILRLAREGAWRSVAQALPARFALGDSDVFVARLAGAIDPVADDPAILDVTALLADHLGQQRSLAAQRLGQALGDRLLRTGESCANPLRLAKTVTNARRLLRARLPLEKAPGDAVHAHDSSESFLKAYGLLAAWRQTPSAPEPAMARKDVGGVVSWGAYQLERGYLRIRVSEFSSTYATRGEEMLSATQHPLNGIFQFGPYSFLIPGLYKIAYLGEAAPSTAYELRVTSNFGKRTLASAFMVAATCAEPLLLGTVVFSLVRDEPAAEFTLRPVSTSGKLISRGVTISRESLLYRDSMRIRPVPLPSGPNRILPSR